MGKIRPMQKSFRRLRMTRKHHFSTIFPARPRTEQRMAGKNLAAANGAAKSNVATLKPLVVPVLIMDTAQTTAVVAEAGVGWDAVAFGAGAQVK